jgi:hypothetical protein
MTSPILKKIAEENNSGPLPALTTHGNANTEKKK